MRSKRLKYTIVFAVSILILLIVVGVVQSLVLTHKRNSLNALAEQNVILKQEKDDLQTDHENQKGYLLDGDGNLSERYRDDYKNHNTEIDEDATGDNVDNDTIIVIVK